VVSAIENDTYRGYGDFSVTELIAPAYMSWLKKQHADNIEEDAADQSSRLLGQATHSILERSFCVNVLKEFRLTIEVNGYVISGQADAYDIQNNHLFDYKITSVWKYIFGSYTEWEQQLNLLTTLIKFRLKMEPDELFVYALLRDWSKRESLKKDDYPNCDQYVIPVKKWAPRQRRDFIFSRLDAHTKQPHPDLCTDEERWLSGECYSVMKEGRKASLRNLKTEEEAAKYIEISKDKTGLSIEHRPGIYKRCEDYCLVRRWCKYYAV
jgi:hypothetical protein